jgi:flagellar biosynthesis chaperone FliJ
MQKKYKLLSVNVNSLISNSKKASLIHFIENNNPDIICMCETKLKPVNHMSIKNYDLIRRDRILNVEGGGVAICIKKKFNYEIVKNRIFDNFNCIEPCIISLQLQQRRKLFIIALYAPKSDSDIFLTEFEKIFEVLNLSDRNNYYILAGDFNAKHESWSYNMNPCNPRGTKLFNWLQDNHINRKCQLYKTDLPTYPRTNSFLDFAIIDARINVEFPHSYNKLTTLPFDSDHNAFCLHFGIEKLNEKILPYNDNNKFDFKKTDWLKFKLKLDENFFEEYANCGIQIGDNCNISIDNIDRHLEILDKIIRKTINDTVPKVKNQNDNTKFYTTNLKRLLKKKSELMRDIHRIYRHSLNVSNQNLILLKSLVRNINSLIKQQIRSEINKKWTKRLQNIKPDANMFPEIKKIFRNKTSNRINKLYINDRQILINNNIDPDELSITNSNEYSVTDQAQINTIMGSFLEKVHNNNSPPNKNFHNNVVDTVHHFKNQANNSTYCIFSNNNKSSCQNNSIFTNFRELKGKFTALKNKVSSGIDDIPNIVLKNLSEFMISKYVILFNNAINCSYFPKRWKTAKIVLLKKPGKDPNNPENYRPISMMPNISKVFETLINDKLIKFTENKKIIPENQFGFRHKHGTINAVTKLTSDICWFINKKYGVGACLIDFEKAFNSIWLDGLIYKLIKYQLPEYLVALISDMVFNNKFCLQNDGTNTKFCVKNGLLQGTVNAPILFSIYMADLLTLLSQFKGNDYAIAFADDIIVYSAADRVHNINVNVQKMFNVVRDYSKVWLLKINYDKCETILFRDTVDKTNADIRKNWNMFQIKAPNNITLAEKKIVKYLGIKIHRNLKYTDHIKYSVEKGKKALMAAKKLFYNKNICKRVKIICYQTLIRPILAYGAPIWYNVSASLMETMRKFERKCIRVCTNINRKPESGYRYFYSNKYLYKEAKIIRIDNFIIKLVRKHYDRAQNTPENGLISHIFYHNEEYIHKTLFTGFIAPEHFIYLDSKGYIQNQMFVPILYHYNRRATDKTIQYSPGNINGENLIYDTTIPERDRKIKRNHWWLENV